MGRVEQLVQIFGEDSSGVNKRISVAEDKNAIFLKIQQDPKDTAYIKNLLEEMILEIKKTNFYLSSMSDIDNDN